MKFKLNKININFKSSINIKSLHGYKLPSSKRGFNISGAIIKNIIITNKKLSYPFVVIDVNKKIEKLINKLTDILIDEESTSDSIAIILDHIEKFRQLIKNEYRMYLKKKDLALMAKKLDKFQKEAYKKNIIVNKRDKTDTLGRGR